MYYLMLYILLLILTCFISMGHLTDIGSMKCMYVNINECECES